jgi:hypothetical protein
LPGTTVDGLNGKRLAALIRSTGENMETNAIRFLREEEKGQKLKRERRVQPDSMMVGKKGNATLLVVMLAIVLLSLAYLIVNKGVNLELPTAPLHASEMSSEHPLPSQWS